MAVFAAATFSSVGLSRYSGLDALRNLLIRKGRFPMTPLQLEMTSLSLVIVLEYSLHDDELDWYVEYNFLNIMWISRMG